MPSTYTVNLGIEKPATGEQSGTWGDTTNINFDILDQAINGCLSLTLASAGTSGSPNTLAISDGATSDGRNKWVEFVDGGDLGATAYVQLTPNDAEKIVFIRNSLSASRSVILFQGTYDTGRDLEVPAGVDMVVKFSGGGATATTTDIFTKLHATEITTPTLTAGTADINDGTVEAVIGGTTPKAGTFTTLTANTNLTINATTTVDGVIDDDTMSTASATKLATSESIKAYVDTTAAAQNELSEVLANGNTTGANNIIVDSGQAITTNTINETTAGSGVTIDSVLLKDDGVNATNLEITNIKANDGTAAGSIANSTGAVTITSFISNSVDIGGGNIDDTTIGGTTPASGAFTTLSATGNLTVNTNTLYVDTGNDKVIIGGTSSSATSLGIFNGSDNDSIVRIDGADQTTEFLAFGVGDGYARLTAGNTSGSGFNTSMTFYTAVNGAETHRMTLDENGWLGIGQTNPGRLLDLEAVNNDAAIRLTDNSANSTAKDGIISALPYNTAQDDFLVLNARTEASSNEIHIGGQNVHVAGSLNSPDGVQGATTILFYTYSAVNTESYSGDGIGPRLTINNAGGMTHSASTGGDVWFNNAASNADFTIKGQTDTYLLRVDASTDKVGIGLSAPSEKLDVEGNIRSVDTINGGKLIARGLDATLYLDITESNNAKIFYDTNDLNIISGSPTAVGNIEMQVQADGDIVLGRTAGKRLFLDASSGYVGIGTENPQNALHVAQDGGGSQPVAFGSEPQIIIGGNHSGGGNQGYHGSLWFAAGDGLTDFNKSAGIVSYSASDVSSSNAEADLSFYTTNNGTTTPALRAYIFDSGQFHITGSGSVLSGFGSAKLIVDQGANTTPATSGSGSDGTLALRGNDNAIIDMGVNGGTYTWLQATNVVDRTNNYPFTINPNGGNVGVGLNNPSTSLHVRKGSSVSYYKDTYATAIFEYDESRLQIAATDGGSDSACVILSAGTHNWITHARGPDLDNRLDIGYYLATGDSNIGGNIDPAISITTEGHVTHPDQPSGRMHGSSASTGQTIGPGASSDVKIRMGSSSQLNGGTTFTDATDRLTVGGTGRYVVMAWCSGSIDQVASGDGIQPMIRINGSSALGTYEVPISTTGSAAGDEFTLSVQAVLELNDGDYLELWLMNIGTTSDFTLSASALHAVMVA